MMQNSPRTSRRSMDSSGLVNLFRRSMGNRTPSHQVVWTPVLHPFLFLILLLDSLVPDPISYFLSLQSPGGRVPGSSASASANVLLARRRKLLGDSPATPPDSVSRARPRAGEAVMGNPMTPNSPPPPYSQSPPPHSPLDGNRPSPSAELDGEPSS